MRFIETALNGSWLIELDEKHDERGYFARTYCEREFGERGLETSFVQHNTSLSKTKGTLRGMHFQNPPHSETKVMRCIRGAILDVIVDLRPGSPDYKRWQSFKLTDQNGRLLYVPSGFAHGFLTLTNDTQVAYLVSAYYEPEANNGVRWNDPAFGIEWPFEPTVLSEQDQNWADFAG